jgi:hypothetical protein
VVRERCIQAFEENRQGKGPLGKPRRRWEDNIKMDIQKSGVKYLHLFGTG